MSRIAISGQAVTITSKVKLADLRTVEKYRPDALTIKGGEDGKEIIFAVGTTSGEGNLNTYGASFGAETYDEGKYAVITKPLTDVVGDVKEYVADMYGAAKKLLDEVEARIPAVLEEIAANKKEVMDSITIA